MSDNAGLTNSSSFIPRARRFLTWLAAYLEELPDDLVVHGVVLKSEHAVVHGGFSNVYRGKLTDTNKTTVEVALKVLKIFQDQSDETRRLLNQKFIKEALVWHSLKHANIVPFLGVDSTTFPSPSKAMVCPWMPRGSVLKYMTEHSPSSVYALDLLYDVAQGLKYLHSVNVIHGDLCGRNILIGANGRARLADFGLAAFIDLETSIKSSTRSGSTRWMAPELLLPPPDLPFKRTRESDVWAFGCVCCEIWSEGEAPFSQFTTDTLLVLAISEFTHSQRQESPYPVKPHDTSGSPMSDRFWEMVQCCFRYNTFERPTADLIIDTIASQAGLVDWRENDNHSSS
ncbi:kinase-like domain-containing protein [Mycena sanguinolenta]|nr:kinase-like domain-containing protein [Mycena sanguinolenta]